jgi:hypothetical protein
VASVRAHLARRAFAAAGLWGSAAVGAVLAAAWLLAGPGGWRQGSAAPLLLDLGALLAVGVVVQGARTRVRRRLGEAPVARAMEESVGLRAGLVQGALELHRSLPAGVSGVLVERAAAQAVDVLQGTPAALAGALGGAAGRWVRRGGLAAGAAALALALLAVAAPGRAALAWSGLASPLMVLAAPALEPLSVSPGSVEVPRGSDVEVRIRAPGRATAELAWQAAGDVPRTENVALDAGVGVKRFRALSAAVEYRVGTPDGASSGPFRLTPVDHLFVGELRVQVAYPPHTGMPPEERRGDVGVLRVPEGTRIVVEGRASRPLSRAALLDEGGEPAVELTVGDAGFEGAWVPARSGRYAWRFLDARGGEADVPPGPLEVWLVPDAAPTVSIPIPGRDTVLAPSLRQPLILEARDDYGLRRLQLVAYRVAALGDRGEPVVQGLDLEGARSALARPLLDLAGWGLLPGDEVRYFAEAVDNAPRPGTARSAEYALRMPHASQLRRGAGDQLDAVADRLGDLAAEAQRKAAETRDLEREAAAARRDEAGRPGDPGAPGELGYREKEEVRGALEGQRELVSRVDSLGAELEALQRAMEDAGQADPGLRADLEELRQLLQELAGGDPGERLEEMARALEGPDPREAARSLQELAKHQDALRERLEQSLDRFRRAAVGQEFRAARGDMEDLADKERALAGALEEGDRPELRVRQQASLEQAAGDLQERMDTLGVHLERLGEADAAREVSRSREQAGEARTRMAEARDRAGRGERTEAGEKANEAADRMDAAADRLDGAQRQMAQERAQAALEALRRATDDALALARRQSGLRSVMVGAAAESLVGMRGDEASLVQGVRNLAQTLQDASEGILTSNLAMTAQMGRAMESLQRTVEALEGRRGAVSSPVAAAGEAVDDLNRLALLAMATADQMNARQGEGEGGGDTAEQLQQLAQQQGQMVDKTARLTPLQLGEQALLEQLQRLAEEQRSVADALEDLSEEERAEAEALGDLSRLAGEAEALAEALARGRLTPETLQRQERLFHRLLDAGRSLEKEDEDVSDEREPRSPGSFQRGLVTPLAPDRLGTLRYRLPGPEELQRLPPAVRQLVLRYFERLNRGGGAGGAR